jgi:hypothetical protein
MRPYLITDKLMRPSNMKRLPTPGLDSAVTYAKTTSFRMSPELTAVVDITNKPQSPTLMT